MAMITVRTCALFTLAGLFTFCSFAYADRNGGSDSAATRMPSHLRVGYTIDKFSDVDVNDAKAAVKVWMDMIVKRRGAATKTELLTYQDLPSLEKAIRDKKIDLVFLYPEEYLEIKNRIPFEPVAISTPLNDLVKRFSVLVRKDRGIQEVRGLRGRGILVERSENSGLLNLWFETLLMREGALSARDFFLNVRETNKTSQAVLPVFFGQADACVVSHSAFGIMTELNPQLSQEIAVIALSAGYIRGVVCMSTSFHEKYGGLVEEILSIHAEAQGKQILTLIKVNRMVPFESSYLETVEALLREHRALKLKLAKNR
jgi:phosphonate transport system substrate-binding protein